MKSVAAAYKVSLHAGKEEVVKRVGERTEENNVHSWTVSMNKKGVQNIFLAKTKGNWDKGYNVQRNMTKLEEN